LIAAALVRLSPNTTDREAITEHGYSRKQAALASPFWCADEVKYPDTATLSDGEK
jgi:hypothetical protein